jgi:hypothetical protein
MSAIAGVVAGDGRSQRLGEAFRRSDVGPDHLMLATMGSVEAWESFKGASCCSCQLLSEAISLIWAPQQADRTAASLPTFVGCVYLACLAYQYARERDLTWDANPSRRLVLLDHA